ncbi:MAG: type II toxin-antitoxin system HigB family toxin [Candidatus Sulfotelmatobacter sp.]
MILVGRDVLDGAGKAHRGQRLDKALAVWAKVVEEARWKHFSDVRQSSPSAVKGFVVFNIKGNQFRLVAKINYKSGVLTVEKVMTHAEYDRWSENLK